MNNTFRLYPLLLLILSHSSALYPQSTNGRLPVKVIDTRTRQVLPASHVCIEKPKQCLFADKTGKLSFDSLTPGLYTLTVSSDGYDTMVIPSIQIKSGLNEIQIVELVKSGNIQSLEKMLVVGRKLAQKKIEQTTSITRVNNFVLSNTAGTGNDLNRVLALLPSTVSGMGEGFDNNLYVRGGSSRENVYLIDGIQFDNASHFSSVNESGGKIGFLNSTLVQTLDFYAGGFPARLPSRLSSVIDLNLRTGSFIDRKHQVDLNMSGIGLTTEGPLFNSSGSYLVSARLVDLRFLKPLLTVGGLPRYGDVQVKTVLNPTENQTIKLVGIGAFDHFSEDPETFKLGNTPTEQLIKYDEYLYQGGGGVFWSIGNELVRNEIGINGTARQEEFYDKFINCSQPPESDTFRINVTQYSKYHRIYDSIVDVGDTLYQEVKGYTRMKLNGADDRRWRVGLTEDFSLYIAERDQINAGLFATYERLHIQKEDGFRIVSSFIHLPDSVNPAIVPGSEYIEKPFYVDSSLALKHGGGYLEYILQRGPLKVVAGVRSDYYTVLTDYGISPRLGSSLTIPSLGTFSMSGGLYYQFPSDFSGLLAEIISRNPNWSTSDAPLEKARLQRNWQAVLGYERQVGSAHFLTAETYLKWYDREYPFAGPNYREYGANDASNTWRWKLDDPDGKKRAYGLEVSFQKKEYDLFYYSFNYSLFNVENRYTDGRWYTDENCVRNAVGVSIGSNFLKHHGVSLRLQFSEGKPYTPAVYNKSNNRYMLDTTKEFYSSRLPSITSVNLRYSFKIFRKWGNIIGYIEVWNLLNLKPVVERYFDPRVKYRDYTTNGILPVAGITVDF